MRIDLGDGWWIETDASCVTLGQSVITGATGSKRGAHLLKAENVGKARDVTYGFYATVTQAASAYVRKAGSGAESGTAQDLIKAWEACTARVEAATKGIKRGP